MAKKWSPNKEHRGPQHQKPSYISNVMGGNSGKPGVEGVISNAGNGSEDGSAFPKPPTKPHIANNGKGDWESKG
jgi:hypothetical protein